MSRGPRSVSRRRRGRGRQGSRTPRPPRPSAPRRTTSTGRGGSGGAGRGDGTRPGGRPGRAPGGRGSADRRRRPRSGTVRRRRAPSRPTARPSDADLCDSGTPRSSAASRSEPCSVVRRTPRPDPSRNGGSGRAVAGEVADAARSWPGRLHRQRLERGDGTRHQPLAARLVDRAGRACPTRRRRGRRGRRSRAVARPAGPPPTTSRSLMTQSPAGAAAAGTPAPRSPPAAAP